MQKVHTFQDDGFRRWDMFNLLLCWQLPGTQNDIQWTGEVATMNSQSKTLTFTYEELSILQEAVKQYKKPLSKFLQSSLYDLDDKAHKSVKLIRQAYKERETLDTIQYKIKI